ncbi:MAG: DUF192 domain-containing protein [Leptolyngbyaceae cyanobacterium]
MKFFTQWRLGAVSCALLSLLGLASCVPAASEVDPIVEPSPPVEPPPTALPNADSPSDATDLPIDALPPAVEQLLAQGQILPVTATVELGEQTIGLEVAHTPQQQAIGLMAREALADDRGMLFPFEPARPVSFWMKNVLIPLDMVFIYDDEIVAISSDVPPCEATPCPTYGPDGQAIDYVLELRGGLAAELGLQVEQPIAIDWLDAED